MPGRLLTHGVTFFCCLLHKHQQDLLSLADNLLDGRKTGLLVCSEPNLQDVALVCTLFCVPTLTSVPKIQGTVSALLNYIKIKLG